MRTIANGHGSRVAALNAFDRHFINIFRTFDAHPAPARVGPAAPYRFDETDEAYVLSAELPGVRREDLEVTVAGGELHVVAKRQVAAPEGSKVLRRERGSFTWDRTFRFAGEVAEDDAKATLEHGVLTIELPKAPEVAPRRIEVEVG